jgi:hypothetical protein
MGITGSLGNSSWALVTIGALSLALPARGEAVRPYILDERGFTITVNPVGDVTDSLMRAMSYLSKRKHPEDHWTLKITGGDYNLTESLYGVKLANTDIMSDLSEPAKLRKARNFDKTKGEYLLVCRYCQNVTIKNIEFHGSSPNYSADHYYPKSPYYSDQGIWLTSTKNVTITNNGFFDFGNSALRVNTYQGDPVKGVNSSGNKVVGNLFRNVFQTSTTADNDWVHGGTAHYLFQGNVFYDLRNSIKFASRTAGATDVQVLDNTIHNSSNDAFEMVGYNNIEFSGNTIRNLKGFIINCYTNDKAPSSWTWGSGFVFKNNDISGARYGIRFVNGTYANGKNPTARGIVMSGNKISDLGDNAATAFRFSGPVDGLTIRGNALESIRSRSYWSWAAKTTNNLTLTDNTVDGSRFNNPR